MHNYRYSYREQWLTSLNAAIVFLKNIGSIYTGWPKNVSHYKMIKNRIEACL